MLFLAPHVFQICPFVEPIVGLKRKVLPEKNGIPAVTQPCFQSVVNLLQNDCKPHCCQGIGLCSPFLRVGFMVWWLDATILFVDCAFGSPSCSLAFLIVCLFSSLPLFSLFLFFSFLDRSLLLLRLFFYSLSLSLYLYLFLSVYVCSRSLSLSLSLFIVLRVCLFVLTSPLAAPVNLHVVHTLLLFTRRTCSWFTLLPRVFGCDLILNLCGWPVQLKLDGCSGSQCFGNVQHSPAPPPTRMLHARAESIPHRTCSASQSLSAQACSVQVALCKLLCAKSVSNLGQGMITRCKCPIRCAGHTECECIFFACP